MSAVNKNLDTVHCRFSPSDLSELGDACEIPGHINCLPAAPGSTIDTCPDGYVGVYAQCFSEANLRLPLSRFFCMVLEYYNLRLSQVGPLALVRVTCFEMQCRALGITPSIGLFRYFFSIDSSKNTYSFMFRRFSKTYQTPPCFLKTLTSAKLWRSNFFLMEARQCPIYFKDDPIEPSERKDKDPLPVPPEYDPADVALLSGHRIHCRSFSSPVLAFCRVSLALRPMGSQLAFYWAAANPKASKTPVGPC